MLSIYFSALIKKVFYAGKKIPAIHIITSRRINMCMSCAQRRTKFAFDQMTEMVKLSMNARVHNDAARQLSFKKCCAVMAPVIFIFITCAPGLVLRAETIFSNIDQVAKSLAANRIAPSKLKDMKVGKSGYYYLLDNEGTVLSHPNQSIEGINFSGIPMVKAILEKKSGCFIQFFDGREKIIVFRNAEPRGVLCLTIDSEEVEGGSEKCQRLE